MGASSQWNLFQDEAQIMISLPASGAENQRTLSIRKSVVGDRKGRTRNDLVIFRVRLRMGQDQEHINQERIEH
jgi:hypothetical protein